MKILKPAEGRTVFCPRTYRQIGPEGIKVNQITTYWHRRILAGDVVEASIGGAKIIPHDQKEKISEPVRNSVPKETVLKPKPSEPKSFKPAEKSASVSEKEEK